MAVHGLKNVWSKTADASFHLTTVACVEENGFAVHPRFIFPGQRISRDMPDGCNILNGCVTVAPKGFMKASLFEG